MEMSKNFEYLSVSKGHLKASLGSTQNSTFVARVVSVFLGTILFSHRGPLAPTGTVIALIAFAETGNPGTVRQGGKH